MINIYLNFGTYFLKKKNLKLYTHYKGNFKKKSKFNDNCQQFPADREKASEVGISWPYGQLWQYIWLHEEGSSEYYTFGILLPWLDHHGTTRKLFSPTHISLVSAALPLTYLLWRTYLVLSAFLPIPSPELTK